MLIVVNISQYVFPFAAYSLARGVLPAFAMVVVGLLPLCWKNCKDVNHSDERYTSKRQLVLNQT